MMNIHLDGVVEMVTLILLNGYVRGNVNIHADEEYAFGWSCGNDYIVLLNGYVRSSIVLHADDECAFLDD